MWHQLRWRITWTRFDRAAAEAAARGVAERLELGLRTTDEGQRLHLLFRFDRDTALALAVVGDVEQEPNELCWSSAVALGDQVAAALDAELLDEEPEESDPS